MPDYATYRRIRDEERQLIAEADCLRRRRRISSVVLLAAVFLFLGTSTLIGNLEPSESKLSLAKVNIITYGTVVIGKLLYDLHLGRRDRSLRMWAGELMARSLEFQHRVRGPLYGE